MLLHIVFHTKMCLSENKTLSPFCVIFLLQRPCSCPLRMYVPTNWAYVPCLRFKIKFMYAFLMSPMCATCLTRLVLHHLTIPTNYKAANYVFLPASCHILLRRFKYFHQSFVPLNLCLLLKWDANFHIHEV
jgi:hypothetical protein